MNRVSSRLIIYLTFGSVIIYNSWPLGYLLNPQVGGRGLASDLEAAGQPYNWLFISSDVLSCLLLVIVSYLLFVKVRKLNRKTLIIIVCLSVFAITTALSALIPLNCHGAIDVCNLSAKQVYSAHNLMSALGFIGLFIVMIAAIQISKGLSKLSRWNIVSLTIWSLWGLLFLFMSIASTSTISRTNNISSLVVACQDVFLILSCLLIFLMVYSVDRFSRTKAT